MGQKRNPFRILINKHLQIKFALFVGTVLFFALFLVWASIEILLLIFIKNYAADLPIVEVLKDIHFHIIYFFFWEGILVIGASVFLTLLLSRRIVGPIYRIQKGLLSFLANKKTDAPELRVRTKDEFKDLSQLVNRCIEELKDKEKQLDDIKEEFSEDMNNNQDQS